MAQLVIAENFLKFKSLYSFEGIYILYRKNLWCLFSGVSGVQTLQFATVCCVTLLFCLLLVVLLSDWPSVPALLSPLCRMIHFLPLKFCLSNFASQFWGDWISRSSIGDCVTVEQCYSSSSSSVSFCREWLPLLDSRLGAYSPTLIISACFFVFLCSLLKLLLCVDLKMSIKGTVNVAAGCPTWGENRASSSLGCIPFQSPILTSHFACQIILWWPIASSKVPLSAIRYPARFCPFSACSISSKHSEH